MVVAFESELKASLTNTEAIVLQIAESMRGINANQDQLFIVSSKNSKK